MTIEDVIQFINLIYPQQEACNEYLQKTIKYKKVAKNEYLLKEGGVSNEVCVIDSGMFRCFYFIGEEEVTTWIMQKNSIIFSVYSFINEVNSYENIQAMKDSEVYFLYKHELDYLYKTFIEFNVVRATMHEIHRAAKEFHLFHIWRRSPIERVRYVIDHYPEIFQEVPGKNVATMLNMNEVTFSRVRKKLMQESAQDRKKSQLGDR